MYLGVPAFSLRQKRLQFGYIRDKAQKKFLSWNQRDFSAGGKEVLIKSVIQSIPTYAMQCFRVPESICGDIDRLCAAFWWGDKDDGRKMHWARWSSMCKPKARGGMGFRDIRGFNRALLAKQVWRLATQPNSLVARVFAARYYREGDIMSATLSSNASFVWRSLMWSRKLVEEGRRWRVGNGDSILVWKDRWITGIHEPLMATMDVQGDENLKVGELVDDTGGWNEAKVESLFGPFLKNEIRNTPISERGG